MPETPEEAALRVKMQKMHEATERTMAEAVSPEKLRNNPYKGKPLDLSVNPFEKEKALGHRMLKSSGFAPGWIEMKKELMQERKDICRMIDEFVDNVRSTPGKDAIHRRFLERVYARVARLRKKIERYNLETPLMDQQLMNVRPDEWVARVRKRLQAPSDMSES